MVMEYLPGGDCSTLLQSFGFLEESLARWFCAEALLGLQYLHGCSIIHRDVKPSNMLITDKGHIKLADFGLSTADEREDLINPTPSMAEGSGAGSKPALHLRTSAVGTPDYLAPELLTRSGYSYEVDFWALGVVLYQLIVGEPPFSADSAQDVYQRILSNVYEAYSEEWSEDLTDLISKLLVTSPNERLGGSANGGGEGGVRAIVAHAFFAPIRPEGEPPLPQRQSPFTPTLKHETDTSNFDMNALQKAQAERMRSQLEMDVGEEEEADAIAPTPSLSHLEAMAGQGRPAGGAERQVLGADGDGVQRGSEIGQRGEVAIADHRHSSSSASGEEDEEATSFKTVNATMLARMQLSEQEQVENDLGETERARADP